MEYRIDSCPEIEADCLRSPPHSPAHLRAYAKFLRDVRDDDAMADKVLAAIGGVGTNEVDAAPAPHSRERRHHRRHH